MTPTESKTLTVTNYKQILIAHEDKSYFHYIKKHSIPLNLKYKSSISSDVLADKSLEKTRLDITKMGTLKQLFEDDNITELEIESITIKFKNNEENNNG